MAGRDLLLESRVDRVSPYAGITLSLSALSNTAIISEQRIGARSVKDELRQNLICKLQRGEELFPGVVGYDDTVVPQIVNAVLSRHNFILLGLRGQAKTRIIRMLTALLDERAALRRWLRDPRQSVPSHLPPLPRSDRRARATKRRSPGWTATSATWKSWRRRT